MTTFTSLDTELYHHGIKGQKWGIRRFQNDDGTLTPAGVERYQKKLAKGLAKGNGRAYAKIINDLNEDGTYNDLRKQREKVDRLSGEFSRDRSIQMRYGYDNTKHGERTQQEEIDSFNKAQAAYYKSEGYSPNDVAQIRNSFRKETERRVNDILGKYGKKEVRSIYGGKSELSKNVTDTIDLNITIGLINELDRKYFSR